MMIFVPGDPVPQGRPRFFRRGDHVGCYDPKTSKDWKKTLQVEAKRLGLKETEGPLDVTLCFYMPRPKSLPKKVIHHVKKPDLDNLVKAVKDALKGVAWKDDSQIVHLSAMKRYAAEDGPGVTIRVCGWED